MPTLPTKCRLEGAIEEFWSFKPTFCSFVEIEVDNKYTKLEKYIKNFYLFWGWPI